MDSWNSNNVAEAIQRKLKQIINLCIEEYDGECDFKQKVFKKTNELMFGFVKSASFNFNVGHKYNIKNPKYKIQKYDGLIKGQIEFEYYEKSNPAKYGAPGFSGNEDGEICQYPNYSDMYYQWYECYNKWIDVTYKVCENNDQNKSSSFMDKLMNNAAFEPLWGNNRSGGDTFSTNRYRNGGDLWGNPQIRKPLGGFKKISANVYKSIYNFTLDLKSAINHYLKLDEALKSDDIEVFEKITSKDTTYTVEEPMVKIQLEKVRNWSYFMNNGHIDQSGGLTKKDSIVYVKDSTKIQLMIEKRNLQIKQKAHDDFKKSNN